MEETFILSPKEVFQQEAPYTKIDSLAEKINSLEERVDRISKILAEILERLEPTENILKAVTRKTYGFTPEDEVD